jgi:hypothetical protein
MIDVVVAVCGDEAYFKMAEISIPSFLRSNPTAKLHVFTDDTSKIKPSYKCEVYDIQEAVKQCDKNTILSLTPKMNDFDNNGVKHIHSHVALLPLLAEKVCSSDYIVKIDVDSFFEGDMMRYVEKNAGEDLILIDRSHDKIMKTYSGMPGVGFLMWRRKGQFVRAYTELFNGHEQETILNIFGCGIVPTRLFFNWNYHICYPFYHASKDGRTLTKKDTDEWTPFYIHVNGKDEPQIDKLKRLEEWYAGSN